MNIKEINNMSCNNIVDDEWEMFLQDDRIENESNYQDINDINIPKCSSIYISTKTKITYFNSTIDLNKIFWKLHIIDYCDNKEGIIKKQMKFNSCKQEDLDFIIDMYDKEEKYKVYDILNHVENVSGNKNVFKDIRKITVGLSKKDILAYRTKKKSAFYNCFVLILRLWNNKESKYREVHVKIFNTGKVEIPGIQEDDTFFRSLNFIKNILSEFYPNIMYSIDDIDTVLINSNFSCGYLVNREILFDILVKKYSIQSLYDPCSYPGVQCKHIIHENGKKIEISFMIFRTGSVLIVGKCSEENLFEVYEFLKDMFETEYSKICQGPITNNKNINKKNDKLVKQRKKNIIKYDL